LKSLFNSAVQTQKQRWQLNSSRNSKKNDYKLDYILNWLKMTPFFTQNNALKLSYKEIWTNIFIDIILAKNKHHQHAPLEKLRQTNINMTMLGQRAQWHAKQCNNITRNLLECTLRHRTIPCCTILYFALSLCVASKSMPSLNRARAQTVARTSYGDFKCYLLGCLKKKTVWCNS